MAGRWLNLELLDSTGAPFKRRPVHLRWEGGELTGRTAADGTLSVEIPTGVTRASLQVAWREFQLDFTLPPVDAIAGAQERLNQLNFPSGAVDGVLGERTRQALRMFQAAQSLPDTGELDPATQAALVQEHGT